MAVLCVTEIRPHSGIYLRNFSAESSFENMGSCNTGYGQVVRAHSGRFRGMIPRRAAGRVTLDRKCSTGLRERRRIRHAGLRASHNSHRPVGRRSMRHAHDDLAPIRHPEVLRRTALRRAARFPELKIVMAHLGGGFATIKGRLLACTSRRRFRSLKTAVGTGCRSKRPGKSACSTTSSRAATTCCSTRPGSAAGLQ